MIVKIYCRYLRYRIWDRIWRENWFRRITVSHVQFYCRNLALKYEEIISSEIYLLNIEMKTASIKKHNISEKLHVFTFVFRLHAWMSIYCGYGTRPYTFYWLFFLEQMVDFKSIGLLFFFMSAIYDIGVSTYLFDIFQYSVIVLIQYPH